MAIKFACPECGATLKVPDAKAGANGKCPKCQTSIVVPEASELEEAAAEEPWEEDPWEEGELTRYDRSKPPRLRDGRGAGTPVGQQPTPGDYKSKAGVVWAITVLMVGFILSTLVYGAASAYQLTLLNQLKAGQNVPDADLNASDVMVQAPACVNLLVILALGVVWCFWTAGVNRNARAISGNNLEYTPRWAAGCFFVPFANLIWPYNAMKEIWVNSELSVSTGLVGVWWGLWLANNFIGQLESRLTLRAETVEDFIAATYISLIGVPFSLASAAAALALVWKLHRLQEEAVGGSYNGHELR